MSRLDAQGSTSGRMGLSPASIMFMIVAFALTAFGLLMIYSASSIMAMTSADTNFNHAYYAIHQLEFAGIGLVLTVILASFDYHVWSDTFLPIIWIGELLLLGLVFTSLAGHDALGASRWIRIGSFGLQPSEFAKPTLILAAASLIERNSDHGWFDWQSLGMQSALVLLVPLVLIVMQPDKGTVLVIGLTIIIMLFLADAPAPLIGSIFLAGILAIGLLAVKDSYSRARIATMVDPWRDPYGDGYQIIQGFYAFGSGGLFGVGLGMSRQKYNYLPMAHNDFIFAVIGEELGLVGTLGLVAAFLLLLWLGYRIAADAPDLTGRLIAAGCVTLMVIQLLVNICGVLAIIPLSGKPIPFISYGGSSIMSTLIMVGLVLSVSRGSTIAGAPRVGMTLVDGQSRGGLRVIEGGAGRSPQDLRSSSDFSQTHAGARVSLNANGTRRVDLGPSATDRLRSRGNDRGRRG